MKCLTIMQCTNLGGMERASAERMHALAERFGVEFQIASPRAAGPGIHLFQSLDPEPRCFDYRGKYNLLGQRPFQRHVVEAARDADVVWVVGTCASSLRAAAATGRPVVLDHHYHHGADLKSRLKWRAFYELLGRGLKSVIYVTDFIRDEAVAIAPWLSRKSNVVRQSLPVPYTTPEDRKRRQAEARDRLGLPQDAWIVGNAGWLIRRKRFDVFLNVAAAVKKRIPEAYFVICGGGELEADLKAQAQALGIADSVRFAGWVSDLGDYEWSFDALLFNSDFDAIPRAPLEAVSYGLPVVASVRYGGMADFFGTGERGIFFRDHDIAGMAEGLCRLHDDPVFAQRVVASAVAHLKAEYSADTTTPALHDILFGRAARPA